MTGLSIPTSGRACDAVSPVDVVDDVGLQHEVSAGHQVVHDEVLVGPDRHRVANAQRAQHVQHLPQRQRAVAHR